MTREDVRNLLEQVATGDMDVQAALHSLVLSDDEPMDFATIDHRRALRQGFPEVIYGAGKTPDQIVETLFLSIHTVRNHIRNLLTKLQVRTRLEAVVVGTRLGLIAPAANPHDELGRSR